VSQREELEGCFHGLQVQCGINLASVNQLDLNGKQQIVRQYLVKQKQQEIVLDLIGELQ
jgi:hypothetical protein